MMNKQGIRPILSILLTASILLPGLFLVGRQDALGLLLLLAAEGGAIHPAQWYRLLTAIFVNGNLLQALLNAILVCGLALWLEPRIGRVWLGALFLLGGISGNLLHTLFAPAGQGGIGTSTSGYALMGAVFYALHCKGAQRSRAETIGLYALFLMGATGLLLGILAHGMGIPIPVGNWGHLGGLLVGLVGGYLLSNCTHPA